MWDAKGNTERKAHCDPDDLFPHLEDILCSPMHSNIKGSGKFIHLKHYCMALYYGNAGENIDL